MEDVARRWLFDPLMGKFIAAIVALAVLYALVRFLQRSINHYVTDTDIRYRTRKLVTLIGYGIGIIVLASIFSDRLGGLTVAFGVAGAGIAFALQEVIASIAGWVAISLGSFYHIGDRVQLGGIKGDVIDIGVLRTTLMEIGDWINGDLYNGRIVRVANSFVFKSPVINYSADFPFLWDEIRFPVKYGSDWKFARDLLHEVVQEVMGDYAVQSKEAWKRVVRKYRIENAQIEPMITLRADENWIEFTARYIVDYKQRRSMKNRLYTRILEEIDKSSDRIRIAVTSMELSSSPPLEIKMQNWQVTDQG